jgi:hypothetical protein
LLVSNDFNTFRLPDTNTGVAEKKQINGLDHLSDTRLVVPYVVPKSIPMAPSYSADILI